MPHHVSEELNDPEHYVPAWTYNPEDGRGRKGPITQEQAMAELAEVGGVGWGAEEGGGDWQLQMLLEQSIC